MQHRPDCSLPVHLSASTSWVPIGYPQTPDYRKVICVPNSIPPSFFCTFSGYLDQTNSISRGQEQCFPKPHIMSPETIPWGSVIPAGLSLCPSLRPQCSLRGPFILTQASCQKEGQGCGLPQVSSLAYQDPPGILSFSESCSSGVWEGHSSPAKVGKPRDPSVGLCWPSDTRGAWSPRSAPVCA